jgi:photosystem II stability/assembly factor-like uncharacterized protein
VKHVASVIALLAIAGSAWMAVATESLPVADIRQNLFASCFLNDQEGWIVGDLGRIFHTVDGAKTWVIQDAGTKRPFVAVACADKTQVWVAGQMGQIAHSSDGGTSWQMQKSGTERQLLDIAFPTAQRGIAIGDFGTLLRTDDAGITWSKVPIPTDIKLPPEVAEVVDPGDVVLYSVAFADADHAWIAGEFGAILASTDGGLTWHPQNSPVDQSLFGVTFADAQRGWAVGLDAILLHTTDGGISWQKQVVEPPKGFPLALYDIQVRGNYGWAVGNSGFLLNSEDAGVTWQLAHVPVQMASSWFRGISLIPDGRGFIVGAGGLILAADRNTFTPLRQRF